MILEAEADLVPMGPRSTLRFGRRRADIPRMSCAPSSAWLRLLRGRRPWFKVSLPARLARGMRSPGRLATHLPHGFGCCRASAPWLKVSPPARSLQNRRPPGRLATRLPQGFGCCVAGAHGSKVSAPLRSLQNRRPQTSCNPSSAWLRLW